MYNLEKTCTRNERNDPWHAVQYTNILYIAVHEEEYRKRRGRVARGASSGIHKMSPHTRHSGTAWSHPAPYRNTWWEHILHHPAKHSWDSRVNWYMVTFSGVKQRNQRVSILNVNVLPSSFLFPTYWFAVLPLLTLPYLSLTFSLPLTLSFSSIASFLFSIRYIYSVVSAPNSFYPPFPSRLLPHPRSLPSPGLNCMTIF